MADKIYRVKDCPICHLSNPDAALRCDCGYDFTSCKLEQSYLTQQKRMPTLSNRGLIGITAFCLPALVSVAGVSLDRSGLQLDQRYAAWIPKVIWSSVLLAAIMPAACILTSTLSLARRLGLTVAMLCLLAVECGLALAAGLMMSFRP